MSAGLGALAPYIAELQDLVADLASAGPRSASRTPLALQNLDGRASSEFRRLVLLQDRRDAGTFFTGSSLRSRLVAPYRASVAAGVRVLDPACGLGDLLLAAAELIPAAWSPDRRGAHAQTHMHGRDLHAPLVEAARARLSLWSTLAGHTTPRLPESSSLLVGDALGEDLDWSAYGLVLLNPSYAAQVVPASTSWASGSVTTAAPFSLDVVRRARPGAKVAAILPDVLRSGSRYAKWRTEIEAIADLVAIDIVGPFDRWTDVDVFIAHLRRRGTRPSSTSVSWYSLDPPDEPMLGGHASVSVGDVVPHRDVPGGDAVPYLTVDAVPAWASTVATVNTVRHPGRLHTPPFVVLRRTSAPTRTAGAVRARAAVYAGSVPVAVENHLIVIRPNAGTVAACMDLLAGFRTPAVTAWLDQRLRLRHLTVAALRELPVRLMGGVVS